MSNPDFNKSSDGRSTGTGTSGTGMKGRAASAARDAVSAAADVAGDAARDTKEVMSDTFASLTSQVSGLLDRQIEGSAAQIGYFARSAKRAADDLDTQSPQLAGLMRSAADRVDSFADTLKDQSLDDIMRSAADYTRRQPALVFGAAALAGFLALRVLKSGSAQASSARASDGGARPGMAGTNRQGMRQTGNSRAGQQGEGMGQSHGL
jgi:ElaB/YqjD/DUF883 family membrane-anchored ribosome-binding protein